MSASAGLQAEPHAGGQGVPQAQAGAQEPPVVPQSAPQSAAPRVPPSPWPPYQRHVLQAWVVVPPPSGDKFAEARRLRLGLSAKEDRRPNIDPNMNKIYHFEFLYLSDPGGDRDLQKLQSIHLRDNTPGHGTKMSPTDKFPEFTLYRHTMLAPVAASWTVGDAVLRPVSHMLGIIAGTGDEETELQEQLGPLLPYALRRRPAELDLTRWTAEFEGNATPLSLAQTELATQSLAAAARQASSASSRTSSRWCVTLTEDQLRRLGRASGPRFVPPAIVYPRRESTGRPIKADLHRRLATDFDLLANQTRSLDDLYWACRACSLSGADLDSCDAVHLVPESVGRAIFDAAVEALQDVREPIERAERLPLRELPLLDARHLAALRQDAWDTPHASLNGLFLRKDLRMRFKNHSIIFTPALRCAHITSPRMRGDGGQHIGPDRAILEAVSGLEGVSETQIPSLHLASLGSLAALFLPEHLCSDFADEGRKRPAKGAQPDRAAKSVRFEDGSRTGADAGAAEGDDGSLAAEQSPDSPYDREETPTEEEMEGETESEDEERRLVCLHAYRFALFMFASHQTIAAERKAAST